MHVQAWMIGSVPQVTWAPPKEVSRWPLFHHLGTNLRPDQRESGELHGDTIWEAIIDTEDGAERLLAAWEWIQLPGVLAISDPNAVMCNAQFVGADGELVGPLQEAVFANMILHATPWQRVVADSIQDRFGSPASAARLSVPEGLHPMRRLRAQPRVPAM